MAAMCDAILGVTLPKPKQVSMSNWEKILTDTQVQYAVLDAVAGLLLYEEATH